MGESKTNPCCGNNLDLGVFVQTIMSPFFELSNEIPDTDIFTKGAEAAELPTVGTVFLGVFVTLLPKVSNTLSLSEVMFPHVSLCRGCCQCLCWTVLRRQSQNSMTPTMFLMARLCSGRSFLKIFKWLRTLLHRSGMMKTE